MRIIKRKMIVIFRSWRVSPILTDTVMIMSDSFFNKSMISANGVAGKFESMIERD